MAWTTPARRIFRWSLVGFGLLSVLGLLGVLGPRGVRPSVSPAGAQTAGSMNEVAPVSGVASGEERTPVAVSSSEVSVVKVGFLLNDIQDLDLQKHRYQIDFYIWYQWSDPNLDPPRSMEFMNDADRWATMRSASSEKPITLDDGSFYYRERIMSTFNNNLPLEEYPYDKPELTIVIEDRAMSSDRLVFTLDDPPVRIAPGLSVPGYNIGEPTATVVNWEYAPMGAIDAGYTTSSRIEVSIPLSRPWLPYSVKMFIPLLVVALCGSIVFMVDPKYVDARFGLAISALLTLVALKWITDGEMPLVDYLGLVDTLFLLTFLFIAAGLIETAYSTWRIGRGDDSASLVRRGRLTLAVVGSAYVAGCALIFFLYLA